MPAVIPERGGVHDAPHARVQYDAGTNRRGARIRAPQAHARQGYRNSTRCQDEDILPGKLFGYNMFEVINLLNVLLLSHFFYPCLLFFSNLLGQSVEALISNFKTF